MSITVFSCLENTKEQNSNITRLVSYFVMDQDLKSCDFYSYMQDI